MDPNKAANIMTDTELGIGACALSVQWQDLWPLIYSKGEILYAMGSGESVHALDRDLMKRLMSTIVKANRGRASVHLKPSAKESRLPSAMHDLVKFLNFKLNKSGIQL